MAKVIVLGNGIVASLSALSLANQGHQVQLITHDSFQNGPERPLVLFQPFLSFLKQYIPSLYEQLCDEGAVRFSVHDLVKDRFGEKGIFGLPPEDFEFISCTHELLKKKLIEALQKNEQITIHHDQIEKLIIDGSTIVGVQTSIGKYHGDFIVDTVSYAKGRSVWFKQSHLKADEIFVLGPPQRAITGKYKIDPSEKVKLQLTAKNGIKGGIIPIEKDGFSLIFTFQSGSISPSVDVDQMLKEAASILPEAQRLMEMGESVGRPILHEGICNSYSDYYLDSPKRKERAHYFPLGESVISCSPSYGRNLSFSAMMLTQLMGESLNSDTHFRLKNTFTELKKFWLPAAKSDYSDSHLAPHFLKFAKWYYQSVFEGLLFKDPNYFYDFLLHYQLKAPVSSLFSFKQHRRACGRILKTRFE